MYTSLGSVWYVYEFGICVICIRVWDLCVMYTSLGSVWYVYEFGICVICIRVWDLCDMYTSLGSVRYVYDKQLSYLRDNISRGWSSQGFYQLLYSIALRTVCAFSPLIHRFQGFMHIYIMDQSSMEYLRVNDSINMHSFLYTC